MRPCLKSEKPGRSSTCSLSNVCSLRTVPTLTTRAQGSSHSKPCDASSAQTTACDPRGPSGPRIAAAWTEPRGCRTWGELGSRRPARAPGGAAILGRSTCPWRRSEANGEAASRPQMATIRSPQNPVRVCFPPLCASGRHYRASGTPLSHPPRLPAFLRPLEPCGTRSQGPRAGHWLRRCPGGL